MAKHPVSKQASRQIRDEAMRIARARQAPGQTKEQTRLIAQGIQKGIEQYIRGQNEKSRELDRRLKQADKDKGGREEPQVEFKETIVRRQHWLPWVLLVATWLGIAAYLVWQARGTSWWGP